ncbi:MAG: hypothetical protein KKI08_10185 [Armatimonadetes bacterium]|nr:hypothetical protein [Armatimonadota bacterium]
MQLHDINPHVINSLLCLIGIMLCLVLIGWGMWLDRRHRAAEDELAAAEAPRCPRPARPSACRASVSSPRLGYRQVA